MSPRLDPRLLLVLAGVVGLVLGLLVLGAMSGGDGGQPVRSPSRPAGSEGPGPGVPETPATDSARSPGPAARDPFVQLVTEGRGDAGEQAVPTPGPTAAGSPPPADAGTEAPAGPAPSPPSGGSEPPADRSAEAAGHATLELLAIATDEAGVKRATIVVDGQRFNPAAGEIFSYGYRLERIEGTCVEASSGQARATMCLPDG